MLQQNCSIWEIRKALRNISLASETWKRRPVHTNLWRRRQGVVYSNWFQAEKFNLKVDYFDKHLSVALDETITLMYANLVNFMFVWRYPYPRIRWFIFNGTIAFIIVLDLLCVKSLRKIKSQPIEYITTN